MCRHISYKAAEFHNLIAERQWIGLISSIKSNYYTFYLLPIIPSFRDGRRPAKASSVQGPQIRQSLNQTQTERPKILTKQNWFGWLLGGFGHCPSHLTSPGSEATTLTPMCLFHFQEALSVTLALPEATQAHWGALTSLLGNSGISEALPNNTRKWCKPWTT